MTTRPRVLTWVVTLLVLAAVPAASRDKPATAATATSQPLPGSGSESSLKQVGQPGLQRRNPRYQLRPGDVLELNFSFSPEFNQTVTVQPDGYITLRGLGDLHVKGRTTPQLTEQLQADYAKILHEPLITVELRDFEKPYFIAAGEVARPGKYDLRGETTVAQAIAIAGGFNGSAKHSQVLLFRPVSDEWVEVKKLNVKKMLNEANLREDVRLQPGDMLFVPKNALSKIAPFIPRPGLGLWLNPLR